MTDQPDTTSYTDRDKAPNLDELRAEIWQRRKQQYIQVGLLVLYFGALVVVICFGGKKW